MSVSSHSVRVVTVLAAASAAGAGPSFTLLQADSGNDYTLGLSVSDDGRYVGGYSSSSGITPIIWDGETPVSLEIPAGITSNGALVNAVAGNGRSAAGYGYTASGIQGIRWDATGAAHLLPTEPESSSAYYAMNDAGTAAAGFANDSVLSGAGDAVVWGNDSGVSVIGNYPGATGGSVMYGVSRDGTRFVGRGFIDGARPLLWESSGEYTVLPAAPGTTGHGAAFGISPDGGTIVGQQVVDLRHRPAYWDESGSAHVINLWPGYDAGFADAASEHGRVIVGFWWDSASGGWDGKVAFIWDAEHGARPLQDVLVAEFGLDLGGWSLLDAVDITPDGKTIVGTAVDEFGSHRAYKVVIPAPGVLPLLVLGGLAAGRRRR